MYTDIKNYYSNRNQSKSKSNNYKFAEQKINYNEILKSRNEILKRIKNQNGSVGNPNISYEGNNNDNSRDRLGQSHVITKSRPASNSSIGSKNANSSNTNRKSTTNLMPSRYKKPKFILKKDKNSQR